MTKITTLENEYFDANKNAWNKRTIIHKNSEFYNVASFKAGKTSLQKIELEALGDVKNKSLLHLQCHFGMDTLNSCYNCFNNVIRGEDGFWRVKGLENKIPMTYSVKATKAFLVNDV